MAKDAKKEWTVYEHDTRRAWGSVNDDGIPYPRLDYWLYSPLPEHNCVATFNFKHDAEKACKALNACLPFDNPEQDIKSIIGELKTISEALHILIENEFFQGIKLTFFKRRLTAINRALSLYKEGS